MSVAKPIYIVDDDIEFLRGIARLLVAYGLEVKTFSSAEDFQARSDLSQAACLILDVHLGSISGIDLMRQVLQTHANAPVVIITANDSERTRREAWDAGCSAFLQKPFSAKVLIETVRSTTARQ
jgi:FixJ family two-component response regulator